MEATESVLSQTTLPDQLGLVSGPCYDQTMEFVQFYEEEFDFRLHLDQVDSSRMGRARLRLQSLKKINSGYILFVPANVFLYPNTLKIFQEEISSSSSTDVVFGGIDCIDPHNSTSYWGLEGLGASNILGLGPIHPVSTCIRVSLLNRHSSTLEDLQCGPFTQLAWILTVLSDETARATVVSEALAEVWSFGEGDHCWDRSVFRSMMRIVELVDSIVPGETERIRAWGRQALVQQASNECGEEEMDYFREAKTAENQQVKWMNREIPFPE